MVVRHREKLILSLNLCVCVSDYWFIDNGRKRKWRGKRRKCLCLVNGVFDKEVRRKREKKREGKEGAVSYTERVCVCING